MYRKITLLARGRKWGFLGARGLAQNDDARNEARRLILADHAGLVTGHTHRPELTHLGPGFYANCGCATEVVDQYDARLGLPPVFLAHRELSWVELEAGAEMHVRLLRAGLDLPGGTVVERLVARRTERTESHPVVVATFPQGESWPGVADPTGRRFTACYFSCRGTIFLRFDEEFGCDAG